MTEGRAPRDRTASFRANNQRAVAALEAVAAYTQAAPGETAPSAAAEPERPPTRASARPTSCSPRTPLTLWKDVVEPDILPGRSLPQIAANSGGYAQGTAPDAGGLNVAPDTIGKITAEWLDQVASSTSDSMIDGPASKLTTDARNMPGTLRGLPPRPASRGSQQRKTMNHNQRSPTGRRRLAPPRNPGLREHP